MEYGPSEGLDQQGHRLEVEGLGFGAQTELELFDRSGFKSGNVPQLHVELLPAGIDDPPEHAGDHGPQLRGEQLDLVVGKQVHDLGRQGSGVQLIDQGVEIEPGRGQGDLLHVTGNALQGKGLGLDRLGGVDLQQGGALEIDADLLKDGEVCFQLDHTPEAGQLDVIGEMILRNADPQLTEQLSHRHGIFVWLKGTADRGQLNIQDEAAGGRGDIADIDELAGAAEIHEQAGADLGAAAAAASDSRLALQVHKAADLEDGLI